MATSQESTRLRIAVIGGCHPQGHPVGYEHGFPEQLRRNLERELPGVQVQVSTHVGWAFKDITQVGTEVLQTERPDVLVVQYGTTDALLRHKAVHWLLKLQKQLYRLIGKQAPVAKKLTTAEELSAVREREPWKAKELAAEALRWLAWITPGHFVRTPPDEFVRASRAMLGTLRQGSEAAEFVLSTLRRYGYVQTHLYRQYSNLIQQVAAEMGWEYVDVMTELYKRPHDEVMVDSQHLSIEGQRVIADKLAAEVLTYLKAHQNIYEVS